MLYPFNYLQDNNVPSGPHLAITYPNGDAPNTDLATWNTQLNGNYTSKTSNGTTVKLYGGSNVEIAAYAFEGDTLVSIVDTGTVIALLGHCFLDSAVESVTVPNCAIIGNSCFENATNLHTVYVPSCTTLGSSVADNGVFGGIVGTTIDVTVAVSLQTADTGNPDGDLVSLDGANTATITYV